MSGPKDRRSSTPAPSITYCGSIIFLTFLGLFDMCLFLIVANTFALFVPRAKGMVYISYIVSII